MILNTNCSAEEGKGETGRTHPGLRRTRAKIFLTGMLNPGSTSPPSKVCSSVSTRDLCGEINTSTIRFWGQRTTPGGPWH